MVSVLCSIWSWVVLALRVQSQLSDGLNVASSIPLPGHVSNVCLEWIVQYLEKAVVLAIYRGLFWRPYWILYFSFYGQTLLTCLLLVLTLICPPATGAAKLRRCKENKCFSCSFACKLINIHYLRCFI